MIFGQIALTRCRMDAVIHAALLQREPLDSTDPLLQASSIANAIELLSDQLTPDVIRAARSDAKGRADLDRIEYALGTIGKALILTDYTIDEEKDMDKLQAFRESQQR